MLKLNTDKLHYAIKATDTGFAYTRSYEDNITADMTMQIPGVSISAWLADSVTNIIRDLKMCGFSEWDLYKAKNYMTFKSNQQG
ncbi:MAG: hypothetical protein GY941_17815 [Planctomycetes bacterium]|nr:hypothetical protein [Planctomycetota bacterium]